MNPLFKLKYSPSMPKRAVGKQTKKINLNHPNAKLSTKKVGGWKGYFITVDGEEKQVNKHKYYTHPANIKKLLTISKTGHATPEDKDLVNYYKRLADSKVEYKIPGISSDINLDPKYTEPAEVDPHSKTVQINIGKKEEPQEDQQKVESEPSSKGPTDQTKDDSDNTETEPATEEKPEPAVEDNTKTNTDKEE
jgi:hypothetical protein